MKYFYFIVLKIYEIGEKNNQSLDLDRNSESLSHHSSKPKKGSKTRKNVVSNNNNLPLPKPNKNLNSGNNNNQDMHPKSKLCFHNGQIKGHLNKVEGNNKSSEYIIYPNDLVLADDNRMKTISNNNTHTNSCSNDNIRSCMYPSSALMKKIKNYNEKIITRQGMLNMEKFLQPNGKKTFSTNFIESSDNERNEKKNKFLNKPKVEEINSMIFAKKESNDEIKQDDKTDRSNASTKLNKKKVANVKFKELELSSSKVQNKQGVLKINSERNSESIKKHKKFSDYKSPGDIKSVNSPKNKNNPIINNGNGSATNINNSIINNNKMNNSVNNSSVNINQRICNSNGDITKDIKVIKEKKSTKGNHKTRDFLYTKKLSKKEKAFEILIQSPILRLCEKCYLANSSDNLRNIMPKSELLKKNAEFLLNKKKELEKKIITCDNRITLPFSASKTAEISFNFIRSIDEEEFKTFINFAENDEEKKCHFSFVKLIFTVFNLNYEGIKDRELINYLYDILFEKGYHTLRDFFYHIYIKKKEAVDIFCRIDEINRILRESPGLLKHESSKQLRFILFTSFLIKEIINYTNETKDTIALKLKSENFMEIIKKKLELYKNNYGDIGLDKDK